MLNMDRGEKFIVWITEISLASLNYERKITFLLRTSLVAQMLRHLLIMWETQIRSLGREDPLEKEMATHSSTLAWKIPWMEECGGLQSMGSQLDTTERLHFHFLPRSKRLLIHGCSHHLQWFRSPRK